MPEIYPGAGTDEQERKTKREAYHAKLLAAKADPAWAAAGLTIVPDINKDAEFDLLEKDADFRQFIVTPAGAAFATERAAYIQASREIAFKTAEVGLRNTITAEFWTMGD
jgi:hypothetical protein